MIVKACGFHDFFRASSRHSRPGPQNGVMTLHLRFRASVVAFVLASSACGGPTSPSDPVSRMFEVHGITYEASPIAQLVRALPLEGVALEVVSGPAAGRRTTSSSGTGQYSLGLFPPGSHQVRASKAGFQSVTRTVVVGDDDFSGHWLDVWVGQPPHTLYGTIFNSRGGRVPFALVEIIGGPNGGLRMQATIDGEFRLDGLATSEAFSVRATHPDFDGMTVPFRTFHDNEQDVTGLVHHEPFQMSLPPRAGQ